MEARNVRRVPVALPMQLALPLDAKPNQERAHRPVDVVMAAIVVALIGFGVVMVYSASAVQATLHYHDPQFFLKRQAAYAVVGLALIFLVGMVDYHRLYKLTYPVLGGVGSLLILCVVGFGHAGGGATRWLAVGPVHVQPAEMAKLAVVMWLAYSLAKKADRVKTFTVGFLPHLIVAGIFMFLCMKQPDFGSSVVLLLLTFTMLFVAGAKVGYILGASILGGVFGAVSIMSKQYRYERYLAWLNMDQHRADLAYQPFQSVMSFGSGGTWGTGIGKGLQTLYLPEAHNDFIAAIIGEELGFIGILVLCLVYLALVARGVRAAFRAPDDYGAYLAFGISTMFGAQALVNLSVALAILPTKGLTLPFLSFGGSSLIVNAVAAGILLSVSRQGEQADAIEAMTPTPAPTYVDEPVQDALTSEAFTSDEAHP
ncbi:Cell division protein FtsW [Labilithrix luteola]|uniref:Probable peptidoglycan glycosyltransferase FtsW n=1 Tax=Labilithrix luteola TaxID=1391654 RepID=A0A0K1PWX2_9BACT|nr:putative lipid II flippase FtsW [Labilithrix luteola]AKU98030.1 Cell division protein FtsW [Labilithrix luteola]